MRASALATAALVAVAGLVAAGGAPPSGVVLAMLAAFVPYGVLATLGGEPDARPALAWSLGLALGAGLVLLVAPPVLSDDLYRYLWDGRVLGHGVDPYRHAPGAPELAHLRDALWTRVSYPEIATIYPPLAQALFAIADAVWHHPASVKALALAGHLGTIPIVFRLAGPRGPRAALLHGLNPLALVESALAGHVDAVAALSVAACVLALASNRAWLAALLAGAAAGIKLVGLVLAPLVGLRDRRATVLAVGLGLASVVPLLGAGGDASSAGLTHYSRRWRGNDGPFALIEAGVRVGVDALGRATGSAPGKVRLGFLAPLIESLEGTPLDPRATLAAEKKAVPDPTDFQAAFVAGLLARALVFAAVLGLAAWLVRRRIEPLLAARFLVFAVLLLAPQVHPWYLLWLLPLEAASGRVAGLVWSAAVLVAYAPLDGWVRARTWIESPIARAVEYGLVVGVLTAEEGWIRKNPSSDPVHVG